MPQSKQARGGSKSGDGRGAAGAAALGVEPLAAGEVSSLTRVRAPAGTIAWWESLTPALRGYLVMEAQRRSTPADLYPDLAGDEGSQYLRGG